ncbi:hypothetical protein DLJ46_03785, partial [Micromonospora globispora]
MDGLTAPLDGRSVVDGPVCRAGPLTDPVPVGSDAGFGGFAADRPVTGAGAGGTAAAGDAVSVGVGAGAATVAPRRHPH